jgi:hypothetical protein
MYAYYKFSHLFTVIFVMLLWLFNLAGLSKGGSSLATHAVGGLSGTASKITGGVGE